MSPITTLPSVCYEINCDACGQGDNVEYEANYHWPSEEEAIEAVREMEWLVTDDKVIICETCQDNVENHVACTACGRGVDEECVIAGDSALITPFGVHQVRVDALVEKVRAERSPGGGVSL